MSFYRSLLVVVALALLANVGCGKRGQLVLPDTPRPAQTGSAPAAEDDGPSIPSAPAAP